MRSTSAPMSGNDGPADSLDGPSCSPRSRQRAAGRHRGGAAASRLRVKGFRPPLVVPIAGRRDLAGRVPAPPDTLPNRGEGLLQVKSNVKAGNATIALNHNEGQVRPAGLKVQTEINFTKIMFLEPVAEFKPLRGDRR